MAGGLRRVVTVRWVGAALVIVLLAGACVLLGRWQLSRLDQREVRNNTTRANLAAPAAPLDEIVGQSGVVGEQHDWRTATVTGRYEPAKQVIVRYRNVKDRPGSEVVTPLVLPNGKAILVNRGFLARQGSELAPGRVPPAPSGQVTITGRLRRSERGGKTSGGTPTDGTARLINGPGYAPVLGMDLYDGYLTVDRQEPAADPAFGGFPGPEIDSGPHFFYALQWFFFAVLAIGGLVYFSRQDYQRDDATKPDAAAPGTPGPGTTPDDNTPGGAARDTAGAPGAARDTEGSTGGRSDDSPADAGQNSGNRDSTATSDDPDAGTRDSAHPDNTPADADRSSRDHDNPANSDGRDGAAGSDQPDDREWGHEGAPANGSTRAASGS